jgi:hypothetical protein
VVGVDAIALRQGRARRDRAARAQPGALAVGEDAVVVVDEVRDDARPRAVADPFETAAAQVRAVPLGGQHPAYLLAERPLAVGVEEVPVDTVLDEVERPTPRGARRQGASRPT